MCNCHENHAKQRKIKKNKIYEWNSKDNNFLDVLMSFKCDVTCDPAGFVVCVCRSCTDIICCALFMLVIVGYMVVGILGKFLLPQLSVPLSDQLWLCLSLSLVPVNADRLAVDWRCLLSPESSMEIWLGLP